MQPLATCMARWKRNDSLACLRSDGRKSSPQRDECALPACFLTYTAPPPQPSLVLGLRQLRGGRGPRAQLWLPVLFYYWFELDLDLELSKSWSHFKNLVPAVDMPTCGSHTPCRLSAWWPTVLCILRQEVLLAAGTSLVFFPGWNFFPSGIFGCFSVNSG